MRIIEEIEKAVKESARQAREDAGYGGRHDDGGASHKMQLLEYWLDGISYAGTGKTKVYASLLKTLEKEQDPEYAEFKRLKEKFEK